MEPRFRISCHAGVRPAALALQNCWYSAHICSMPFSGPNIARMALSKLQTSISRTVTWNSRRASGFMVVSHCRKIRSSYSRRANARPVCGAPQCRTARPRRARRRQGPRCRPKTPCWLNSFQSLSARTGRRAPARGKARRAFHSRVCKATRAPTLDVLRTVHDRRFRRVARFGRNPR